MSSVTSLSAIAGFLNISGRSGMVISKRTGSVKLTLELRPDLAEQLVRAVKSGQFATFGVVDAVVVDRNLAREPDAEPTELRLQDEFGPERRVFWRPLNVARTLGSSRWTQRQRIHRSGDARLWRLTRASSKSLKKAGKRHFREPNLILPLRRSSASISMKRLYASAISF